METIVCANPSCRGGGDRDPVHGREVICGYCARRLGGDLHDLAYVYDELATVLANDRSGSARFDKVTGSRTPPVPVRLEVADHRDEIRHLLVSWTRLVVEERAGQARWPDDRPTAIAGYLASHLGWLQTHPAAGDLCAEVAVALGRARRLLELPGPRVWVPCPDIDGQGCQGRIPVAVDAATVWCSMCGFETGDLRLLGRLLRGSGTALVTSADACHRLRADGIEIKPATIRSWVQRKKLVVRDRDPAGRPLYDIDELTQVARQPTRRAAMSTDRA